MEILKKKIIAGDFEKDIPNDVIEYIASNIGPDVRHLEGAITRLVAYSTIMGGEEITLELAIEALKDFNSKGMGEKNDICFWNNKYIPSFQKSRYISEKNAKKQPAASVAKWKIKCW